MTSCELVDSPLHPDVITQPYDNVMRASCPMCVGWHASIGSVHLLEIDYFDITPCELCAPCVYDAMQARGLCRDIEKVKLVDWTDIIILIL